MPSRFDPPPGSAPGSTPPEGGKGIDATKRYDVYFHRHGHPRLMVYRNVLFKKATPLFEQHDIYGRLGEFIELEKANGQTFFVSRMAIIAFCEHGMELPAEVVPFE